MKNTILILDYGSQYSQLIARRVRELQVYCELFPWDIAPEKALALEPAGIILSGGPSSVYEEGAPTLPDYVLDANVPVLGICYGMQLLAHDLAGVVKPAKEREYGKAWIKKKIENPLIAYDELKVWMSHGDHIEQAPAGFEVYASSENAPVAAFGNSEKHIYGLQFHPEVNHTDHGKEIIQNFVTKICDITADWTPESIIAESVRQIQAQVGDARVLSGVSGGVDSSVATALVHKAVGKQLTGVFVDTGMLRYQEAQGVVDTFSKNMGVDLIAVSAGAEYFQALQGVTEPEQKRKIIGEKFIRIFEREAKNAGMPPFLVQGTIYPDVVESSGKDREKAHKIKSHHNVGGLPEDMQFDLVEPLRYLFKDEVRLVGEALGLPSEMVWRQPFPGPGLAVRCLGEITPQRIEVLQLADAIFREELERAGLLRMGYNTTTGELEGTAQSFVVLLPVKTVGVMGDQRTYEEVAALRAVTTEDFMTADWAKLPYDLLGLVASRIVNEVKGINRVVYDITSKPPGTIEWE